MSEHRKSPEEIEQDIRSTRADIDHTLDALQSKLSPGQLLDQALGYARDGGGQFAANLGRSVRDNPIPLLLTGAGIAWLMMAGRRRGNGEEYEPVQAVDYTAHGPYSANRPANVSSMGAAAQSTSVVGSTTGREADAPETSGQQHGGLGRAAGERVHEARERLSEAAGTAQERAARVGAGAREGFDTARERGASYFRRAGQRGARATSAAGHFLTDHPLVLGTLGLALGAVIAACLPSTRREGELLGKQSDALKRGVRRAGQQQVDKAKDIAEAAMEGGQAEAERQHLTPEDAKREAAHLAQAGADVVTSARQAGEAKAKEVGGKSGSAGEKGSPGESDLSRSARKG